MLKHIHTSQIPIIQARDYDYALAKAALQGDDNAWDTLYEDSWQFVLRAARQADQCHLLASDDYKDVTEEAFEKCYEHLERYQGRSRFYRWVAGYVKNLIRGRYARKQTVRRNQYLLENIVRSRLSQQDPLFILIRLERNQILWEAFSQIPKIEQHIVDSILFHRVPPRQIARKLQLHRKQVLQYYDDALIKIRWHFIRLYR